MSTKRRMAFLLLASLACLPSTVAAESTRPDIVIADCEGDDYVGWKPEGEAFGKAPMKRPRTIGHNGNSVASILDLKNLQAGKLTSPEFTMDHNFIRFLADVGNDPKNTGARLLVDGECRSLIGRHAEAAQMDKLGCQLAEGKEGKRRGSLGRITQEETSCTGM